MKIATSLLIVGLLPVVSLAQAPTSAPSGGAAAEIQVLVKKLSDDSFQTRQEAYDQLVRFGGEARPYLEKAASTAADPEARSRAESALAQIDEDRATGATMVTLHMKDASPDQVLGELSRQGMAPIPTLPENLFRQEHMNVAKKVTIDVDRQPFWMAMREFCEKTQLRLNAMGGEQKLVVMQGGDDALLGPAVYTGAFMVVANNVTRSSSINLARDKTPTKSLNLQVTVFAEPKLNVMGHDYYLRLTEAVDDRGNSLLAPSAATYGSMGQDTNARWSLSTSLAIPQELGTRLVRLKGFSRVMMQTKSERWEMADAMTAHAQPPAKSIAGRRYVVEELKAVNDDTYQLKFTMIREAAKLEPWQQFGRGVRVSLQDAEGRPLASRGYNGGGGDEKLTYQYTFGRDTNTGGKTGPAARLVVEVPTEVKEVEVPFEFKDIPLP